ncbi:PEP/pyruvate-binding domain-containing protein [Luteococcus peritonei]|uniref:PEP/pyruvate-binding domain-containing protein n=1 Tax=Luteococcus peritonei TaxID=88874 RepID=A0ABW4RUF8_9ACTN
MSTIIWLDQAAEAALLGGKGANLSELLRAGFPVPNGFVVTTRAYRDYLDAHELDEPLARAVAAGDDEAARALFSAPLPADLAAQVQQAWQQLGGGPVAVRSSGTAEDLPQASFAGQQDSFLNVHGAEQVCDAVRACFASLWTRRAVAYRARHGLAESPVALAVVVQKLVPAEASGVMFTASPTTGSPDEVVIQAAFGLGESVVQGGAADTLVVREREVVQRETADKHSQSVVAEGQGVTSQQLPRARRREGVLDDSAAVELAELGRRVEGHFGCPQDIEWVRTDGVFVLVQSRPVTVLAGEVGPVPEDWPVDDEKAMYVRASIVEQMPDPLSPLFADMVRPAVAESLREVLATYFDDTTLQPGDMDLPTINGYAYYRYSREGMLRLLKKSPQAIAAVAGRSEYNGEKLWNQAHPHYAALVHEWESNTLDHLSSQELLDGVQELLDAGCRYYSSVQALIPLAASAEIPFVKLYSTGARHADDPPAEVFLLGFESRPIQAESSLWALAQWTRGQQQLADALRQGRPLGQLDGLPGAEEFGHRLEAHLERYGHTVYNLDFMVPVPADDPAPLLETLRWYLSGHGEDPQARLARQAEARRQAEAGVIDRLDPARKAILKPLLDKAQHLAPLREDALADVGLAWPVMRRMLAELGRRLVDVGTLQDSEEVYWLHLDELTDLVGRLDRFEGDQPSRAADIAARRATWRGQRAATPPQLLPRNAWYRMFHRFMPAMQDQQAGPVIRGLGASQGRITGPVRLLRGPEDFERMEPGDVLVSPITTPAWTPLFAMAAAVVTDVGGPLSHSSIVAREYGIPAVLGTGIATRRLRDGMLVTVDGDRGTVTLPQGEQPIETGFRPKVPYKFAIGAAAAAAAMIARRVM